MNLGLKASDFINSIVALLCNLGLFLPFFLEMKRLAILYDASMLFIVVQRGVNVFSSHGSAAIRTLLRCCARRMD